MNINEFSLILNLYGGRKKEFIARHLSSRYNGNENEMKELFEFGQKLGVFNKNLNYSFENLVNEIARQENIRKFDFSRLENNEDET